VSSTATRTAARLLRIAGLIGVIASLAAARGEAAATTKVGTAVDSPADPNALTRQRVAPAADSLPSDSPTLTCSADYDETYYKERRRLHLQVLRVTTVAGVSGALVAWCIALIQTNARPKGRLTFTHLDAGITASDATVIVLGVATVVAAISIAALTARPTSVDSSPTEYAAAAAWAEQTFFASVGASILAAAAAASQVFNVDRDGGRHSGLAMVLFAVALSTGALTAIVSNRVFDNGLYWRTEQLLERRSLATRLSKLRGQHWPSTRRGVLVLVVLSLSSGIAARCLILAWRLIDNAVSGRGGPSMATIGSVLWAGIGLGVMCLLFVVLTICSWVLRIRPGRWGWLLLSACRWLYVAIWLAVSAQQLLQAFSLGSVFRLLVLLLSVIALPAAFLFHSRRKGRGPGRFARTTLGATRPPIGQLDRKFSAVSGVASRGG